jgi:hypothetical protein
MPEQQTFLSMITGSFSTPAAENPTVAMIEAAYEHHHIDARYLNCDVAPDALGGAREAKQKSGGIRFDKTFWPKIENQVAVWLADVCGDRRLEQASGSASGGRNQILHRLKILRVSSFPA